MKKIRKAVIPAAGFGTRFLPATKAMPKEMLPIVDKPIIQYIVEELVDAGIEDIIIVTGYTKRSIEDHFDLPNRELVENLKLGGEKKKPLIDMVEHIGNMANIVYVRQKGPYGNGTPLINVQHLIGDEPFIYTWSDDFIVSDPPRFKQLISAFEKYQAPCLGSIRVTKDEDYGRYGMAGGIEIDPGVIAVKEIIEKPGKEKAPSDLANVSGFIFTPDIFDFLEQAKQNMSHGELYWNDAVKLMLEAGKVVYAVEIKGGKYYDTGNKMEYMKTCIEFAANNPDVADEFKAYLKEFVKTI
jgi:UTP--glucose-1-phosphate uridylyltransferase